MLGCRRAAEQHQQIQHLEEDQVHEAHRHRSRTCPADRAHRSSRSEIQADFWNPTGRAGHHGRSRERVSVGATVHPALMPLRMSNR